MFWMLLPMNANERRQLGDGDWSPHDGWSDMLHRVAAWLHAHATAKAPCRDGE